MLGYRWEEYVGHNIAEFHVDRPVIDDILCRLAAARRCTTSRRACAARTARSSTC
jgi:hypothetical protein